MFVFHLLADLPPPPPEFPVVHLTVPHPIVIMIAGLCLAAALAAISARLAKPDHASRWNWPAFTAIGVLILTLVVATWSASEYRKTKKRRGIWRGNPPVPQLPVQRPSGTPEDQ